MNLELAMNGRRLGRPRIKFTKEQLLEMARRYESGESLFALATDYGFGSNESVSLRLRELGVRIRKPWEANVRDGSYCRSTREK